MHQSLEKLDVPVDPHLTHPSDPRPLEGEPAVNNGVLGRSIFALIDQGLVSCGNFFTSVLLARSLSSADYGRYALLLDAVLFFNSLQAALLIYPLLVRCPSMDQEKVRRFAGTCVMLTLLLAIPLGVVMFAYGSYIASAKIGLFAVFGQTMWQCQETVRRTLFARGKYANALPGDIVSYLGQATLIGLLAWHGSASVSLAFAMIALTCLAACIIQAVQLRVKLVGIRDSAKYAMSFWRTGRWVLASNMSTLVSSVCCSFCLAHWHGTSDVGVFAAISNLMRPSNPLLIALSTLIVPAVALAASKHGQNNLREALRVTRKHTLQGLALLAPYWLILLLVPNLAIRLLYPHQPIYHGHGFELRLFVASYVMTTVNVVVAAMLNGFNRSRRALAAQLIGTAASAGITIPLTIHIGLRGLLLGTLISNTVIAMSLIYLLVRLQRHLAGEVQGQLVDA